MVTISFSRRVIPARESAFSVGSPRSASATPVSAPSAIYRILTFSATANRDRHTATANPAAVNVLPRSSLPTRYSHAPGLNFFISCLLWIKFGLHYTGFFSICQIARRFLVKNYNFPAFCPAPASARRAFWLRQNPRSPIAAPACGGRPCGPRLPPAPRGVSSGRGSGTPAPPAPRRRSPPRCRPRLRSGRRSARPAAPFRPRPPGRHGPTGCQSRSAAR